MLSKKELDNVSSIADWLVALLIFILPLISILLSWNAMPPWTTTFLYIVFLGSTIFAFILVVRRNFPRWSFSYLGFILTTFVFYSLLWGLWGLFFYQPWMLIFGSMDYWSLPVRLLYQGLLTAFLWFLVLSISIAATQVLNHWSPINELWQSSRENWTQFSYLIYGGLIFYTWIIFDEYQFEQGWTFAASLSLAIGGWLYLLARGKKMRLFILVGGTTAAMWIIAVGKWTIVPLQNWPVNLEHERWFEAGWTICSWIVTVIVMLIPALLNFLPTKSDSIIREDNMRP